MMAEARDDGIKRHVAQCEFTHEEIVLISLCVAIGASALHNDLSGTMQGLHILQNGEEGFGPAMEAVAKKLRLVLTADPRWKKWAEDILNSDASGMLL